MCGGAALHAVAYYHAPATSYFILDDSTTPAQQHSWDVYAVESHCYVCNSSVYAPVPSLWS